MTSAASPNRAHTVEKYKPQPADEIQLVCPNPECAAPDGLQLIEKAVTHTAATFYDVGVTFPEIDLGEAEPEIQPGQPELIGIRCSTCRWSYTGPNPLARLVKPA